MKNDTFSLYIGLIIYILKKEPAVKTMLMMDSMT